MGMLSRFPTEVLILHKQSGETCDVKALVDPKSSEILIDDTSVVIEEDDYFERNLSNGTAEFYLVTERGFERGMGTIPDHYLTKVKKIKEPPIIETIANEKPRLIFISHSTKDKPYTKAFVDLLEGIGLDDEQIVCSSYPGLGVPLDAPVFDWLVSRFQYYDLHVLFFLSHNYYKSAASLNEMGAAWAMKHRWTAVLLPGFGFSDINGCVDPRQISIKIDGDREELKVRLFELKQNLIAEFGLKDLSQIKWERVRNQFLKTVDEIKVEEDKVQVQSDEDAEEFRKEYKKLRKEANRVLTYYANVYTNVVEKPDDDHAEAEKMLRDIGSKFKSLAEQERGDCPEVLSNAELMEVFHCFIGLSNSMVMYPGGDTGRRQDDVLKLEEKIKSILGIT